MRYEIPYGSTSSITGPGQVIFHLKTTGFATPVQGFVIPRFTVWWRTDLEGNQLGEFGRGICHRIFCSVQAASRAEQRADFAESLVRRVVHDRNQQLTRQECR